MDEYAALTTEEQRLIAEHLALVLEANKTLNLTRIETVEDGMILHVEDSLAALDEVNAAPSGMLVDVGSGGGYPGIPLAIATKRDTLLVDARQKKVEALASIIEQLDLSRSISVFAGRAELLARKQPECCSVVTARALAKLSVILELASPLLVKGGRLVCYKAHIEADEFNDAKRVAPMTGMYLVSDREFTLSDGTTYRRILCYEKKAKPQAKLPRKEGYAQKHPL